MNIEKLNEILELVKKFGSAKNEILAIGLCGSRANGTNSEDSDIDLTILVADKNLFRKNEWFGEVDFKVINEQYSHHHDAEYGAVWSRHIFLKSGIEIEFSFANITWAETSPLDEGTLSVVQNGYKIIYDPHSILNKLVETVARKVN